MCISAEPGYTIPTIALGHVISAGVGEYLKIIMMSESDYFKESLPKRRAEEAIIADNIKPPPKKGAGDGRDEEQNTLILL